MNNDNLVVITGNVTRDPETREFGDENSVTNFGLAWNQRKKVDDEYTEQAHFFDIAVWGKHGQLIARKMKKGDYVTVYGRLNFRSWENDEGQKRNKVDIVANEVRGEYQFRKSEDSTSSGTQGGSGTDAPTKGDPVPEEIPF